MTAHDKLTLLKSVLNKMGKVVIAYSGGVDSAFLLKVATETLGASNVKAILAISPTYPSREYEKALETAAAIGVEVEIIHTREVDDPKFINNPVDRCYFCKHELFTKIAGYIETGKFKNMIDGSNMDDLKDHRPGERLWRKRKSGVLCRKQNSQRMIYDFFHMKWDWQPGTGTRWPAFPQGFHTVNKLT